MTAWSWEVADDAGEIHDLLCVCDAHQAERFGLPAPARRLETTATRVRAGCVHVLRGDTEAAAMFTLTWEPPFDRDVELFPPASKPAYLSRLAVRPEWLENGSLVGARCLRRAIELAADGGADALRSEANPDLTGVATLLRLFGFEQCGPPLSDGERRRVYLQKRTDAPTTAASEPTRSGTASGRDAR